MNEEKEVQVSDTTMLKTEQMFVPKKYNSKEREEMLRELLYKLTQSLT